MLVSVRKGEGLHVLMFCEARANFCGNTSSVARRRVACVSEIKLADDYQGNSPQAPPVLSS